MHSHARRPILRSWLALALCSFLAACVTVQDKPSLYDRLGGMPAIAAVVDKTIDSVAADPRTRRSFEGVKLRTVKDSVTAQLCEATGGPCKYQGDSMRVVHDGLEITSAEFDAFAQQLVATLTQFKVAAREQDELMRILAPMKSDIVTR